METAQREGSKWVPFILLSFIWGSSFILMKQGMKSLSAVQVASLRIASAGLALMPLVPRVYPTVPRRTFPLILLSGLLGSFIPAYLFCIAETKLDSGLAGILNALTPLFTLLIGVLFFRQRIAWMKWAGVLLGFLGLVLLIWSGNHHIGLANMGYSGFILLATLLYGINVNLVSHYLKGFGARQITTIAMSLLAIPALVILIATGYFSMPVKDGAWLLSTAASMLLGVMGTAVATLLYYILLKRAGGLFSSMVTYGVPFVALFWGLLAGEVLGWAQVACLVIILAGVLLAQRK
jgi:drug/metabolite transporter (DMT)-like permease